MYGRWCLHAQWWGYFNKMKVYFITWFKLKMYKQKVELNLKKKKVPEIFRKNWRKISGNFPENFQFFRGNFPAHITNCRVDINHDFFNKNQKIRFFWFKSDFFDLNRFFWFKLNQTSWLILNVTYNCSVLVKISRYHIITTAIIV